MSAKGSAFDLYLLDVYYEDGGWIENERHRLGTLDVTPAIGEEIDEIDVLAAVRKFTYLDLAGRTHRALDTTDRRKVYAEDYYGSGDWWEVGMVKDHMPVYGLKLRDDE